MKIKTVLLICFSLSLGILFCACQGKSKKQDSTTTETIETQQSEIELSIHPFQYAGTPEKIAMTINNQTNDTIQFGADYEIEYFTGDNWQTVEFPDGIAFIAIMYGLLPGQSENYDIYLYPDMIQYTPGKYRIRKNIFINDERESYFADFEIN